VRCLTALSVAALVVVLRVARGLVMYARVLGLDDYAAVLRDGLRPPTPPLCRFAVQAKHTGSENGRSAAVDRQPLHRNWSAVLRCGMCIRHACKSRPVVYSAQRHKGGVGGPRPPRRTAAKLSTPPACLRTKLKSSPTCSNTKLSAPQTRTRTKLEYTTDLPPYKTNRATDKFIPYTVICADLHQLAGAL
jgi:hypothetical protein